MSFRYYLLHVNIHTKFILFALFSFSQVHLTEMTSQCRLRFPVSFLTLPVSSLEPGVISRVRVLFSVWCHLFRMVSSRPPGVIFRVLVLYNGRCHFLHLVSSLAIGVFSFWCRL